MPSDRSDGPSRVERVGRRPARGVVRTSDVLALVVVAVGIAVLLGWFLDIEALTGVLPRWRAVKPNSAVGFVALGAALWLSDRRFAGALRAVALLAAGTISALTIAEYIGDVDLGIDDLVHADAETAIGGSTPGRPGLMTAIAFGVLALALVLATRRATRMVGVSQALALGAFGLALVSFAGDLYGVPQLSSPNRQLTGMAIHTSLSCMLLAVGTLALRPDRSLVRPITERGPGGQLARRILPAAVVAPLALGWLGLRGQRADWYGTDLGVTLFAVSIVGVFSALVWLTARSLSAGNRARLTALEALAANERELEAFLDRAPAVIFAKNLAGRYVMANRGLEQLLGAPRESIIGRTDDDFFDVETAAVLRGNDRRVAETGRPIEEEEPVVRDGRERLYASVKFPLVTEQGDLYAIGGIASDITERRRAEIDHQRLADRLRQSERLESLGQLAGGVAHDFNNLLGVILNHAAFVRDVVTDAVAREDLDAIQTAAGRGAALSRQLLAFSSHEPTQARSVNVNAVIIDLEPMLRRTLPAHIGFEVSLDPSLEPIVADVSQLEQVLLNLVFNARDAMPNGGRLAVATANAGVDAALASTGDVPPGRYVRLLVSDTGVGMPPSVRDHAFEPFFTTKPKGRGTGLGLATVYGIVKQSGGIIDLDSEEGQGTTFACYLPVVPADGSTDLDVEAGGGAPLRPTGPRDRRVQTILLVEDGTTLRDGLERILRRAGFDVISAASGEEALGALRREPGRVPAMLLTDVMLTGMSGPQLAQMLRAPRPDLQVLFMSGYAENAFEAIEIARGRTLFLHKPFNAAALLDKISQLIPTPGS